MRMRTRSHLQRRLESCAQLTIEEYGAEVFQNASAPLHIEIGCGKGRFITQTALRNNDINYIAIEKVRNVCVLAMEKAAYAELENIRFMLGDFLTLSNSFPDESVDRIYLNFSDPWPKSKNAKRRLTHGTFLGIYKRILKKGAIICFKTDNRELFDYSIETFSQSGFDISEVTYDLHNSGFEENIMTEYEEKFSGEGIPICRMCAKLSDEPMF